MYLGARGGFKKTSPETPVSEVLRYLQRIKNSEEKNIRRIKNSEEKNIRSVKISEDKKYLEDKKIITLYLKDNGRYFIIY